MKVWQRKVNTTTMFYWVMWCELCLIVFTLLKTILERERGGAPPLSSVHKLYTRKHLGTAADRIGSEHPRTSPGWPPGSPAGAHQDKPPSARSYRPWWARWWEPQCTLAWEQSYTPCPGPDQTIFNNFWGKSRLSTEERSDVISRGNGLTFVLIENTLNIL